MTLRRRIRLLVRMASRAALRAAGALSRRVGLEIGPLRGVESLQVRSVLWPTSNEGTPFVYTLPGGIVYSDYGVVISQDGYLMGDVSPHLGSNIFDHPTLYQIKFPVPQRMPGSVALLSSHAHQRYFHWMYDVLPRIELLTASGATYDRLIVNNQIAYQTETLKLLRISPEQIIVPVDGESIRPETLVVPSLPGSIGSPTLRSVQFLRRSFDALMSRDAPSRRLYVTRNDARTRRVANESEIVDLLSGYGFERVALDGQSVATQVDFFSKAEIVVGPHGAGMTNSTFMQQCSKGLVELMPLTYENPCFEIICRHLMIPHFYIRAASNGAPEHDMEVSIAEMRTMMERLGM